MPAKAYQEPNLLYELYVKKRMTMTDIQKYFEERYGVKVTGQTIYNHLKKYDLLKYRGKGKSTASGRMKPKLSPTAIAAQQRVREQRKMMKARAQGKGLNAR